MLAILVKTIVNTNNKTLAKSIGIGIADTNTNELVLKAQWAKHHYTSVPAGLMALTGSGSNPGVEGGFSAQLS